MRTRGFVLAGMALALLGGVVLSTGGVHGDGGGAAPPPPVLDGEDVRTARPAPAPGTASMVTTGTEYVCFWSGDLRIFAHVDNTEVSLFNVRTGKLLPLNHGRIQKLNVSSNPFVLAEAGDSFEGIGGLGSADDELQVRIESTEPVTVWTGSLADRSRHPADPPDDTNADPWGSLIPAFGTGLLENGREVGFEFMGFTTRELRIIALKDPTAPTAITVEDLETNTDSDSDDTVFLTAADAVYGDAEIEVFELDGFEDDTVHVTSNVKISVLAGLALWRRNDWTITPPTFAPDELGNELGTLFYTYAHGSLTIFPTQDGTRVTITDLSDGDDSRQILLPDGDLDGDYDLYTATKETRSAGDDIVPRPANPQVTIIHNSGNAFDEDYVKIEADKPVLVYVGPVGSEFDDFADVAYSIPTGPDSQIVYCYAQNFGQSNDLQIFAFDPDTEVTITSLSFTQNFKGNGQHDFVIGPGMGGPDGWLEGVGDPGTDVWWGAGVWNGEMLRIEANRPITVLNGDYDKPHFGAFVPFVLANPTAPPTAVAVATPEEVQAGETVTLDGTGSFDPDTFPGGQIIRWEWDLDVTVDSDGDTIPDNDIDATGDIVLTSYTTVGVHTAQLTYFDDDGESDTDLASVTVLEATGGTCPHTQGFWKNHEEDWPVDELVLGDELYDKAELLDIFALPVLGDASINLAHQLTAAKLNIESGSDAGPIQATVDRADDLLAGYSGKLPYGVHSSSPEGQEMVAEARELDDYNNQRLTPDCDGRPAGGVGGGEEEGEGGRFGAERRRRRGSGGGGCAGVIGGAMGPAEATGSLLPLLLVLLGMTALEIRRRRRWAPVRA